MLLLKRMQSDIADKEKYLPKPFIGSSHTWALKTLAKAKPSDFILDVGFGSGVIGSELRQRGFEHIYGVESNSTALLNQSGNYRAVASELSEFKQLSFDVALVLDLLEHLVDPSAFLTEIIGLVKPGGRVLISVPNIAHWSVRFGLFFGFFDQYDRGILDRTHLRFFTKRTLELFLAKFDQLCLLDYQASIEPAEFVLPRIVWNNPVFRFIARARLRMANLFPGILAYQHLVLLQKKS